MDDVGKALVAQGRWQRRIVEDVEEEIETCREMREALAGDATVSGVTADAYFRVREATFRYIGSLVAVPLNTLEARQQVRNALASMYNSTRDSRIQDAIMNTMRAVMTGGGDSE